MVQISGPFYLHIIIYSVNASAAAPSTESSTYGKGG